jgi:hypothetical protein
MEETIAKSKNGSLKLDWQFQQINPILLTFERASYT